MHILIYNEIYVNHLKEVFSSYILRILNWAGEKMKQSIKVKEKRIGSGKPIICVPVIKCTQSDIVSEIKSLCKKEIDMIEWRIDFFESIKDYGKIKGLLNEVEGILKGTLFLVTYRSTYQGGNGNLSENEYRNLLLYLAENKKIDFLDVECLQWNEVKKEINQIQAYGKRVIASHHYFKTGCYATK